METVQKLLRWSSGKKEQNPETLRKLYNQYEGEKRVHHFSNIKQSQEHRWSLVGIYYFRFLKKSGQPFHGLSRISTLKREQKINISMEPYFNSTFVYLRESHGTYTGHHWRPVAELPIQKDVMVHGTKGDKNLSCSWHKLSTQGAETSELGIWLTVYPTFDSIIVLIFYSTMIKIFRLFQLFKKENNLKPPMK